MTLVLFFAGFGLLVLLAGAGWWLAGRRAAVTIVAGEKRLAVAAEDGSTGPATPGEEAIAGTAPDPRALLHRVYALAFDGVADEPGNAELLAHAAVADEAATLLARTDPDPRYTPRRPQLLPQLMRAVNDPGASLDAIARIIGQDPTLSANLLRIANSPFYRVQAKPVESLARATTLLGLDGLRPVIAAALVQPVLQGGDGAFGRLPALVWEHTQLAAAAAMEFARAGGEEDAFAAQLLGLLHGLGAIIVVQVLRDQYAREPRLLPDARVATVLLDDWAAPTARRIADGWSVSPRIGEALAMQRQEAVPPDALGRALRLGRTAATLVLLCRLDGLDDAEGRRLLVHLAGAAGATCDVPALWTRLRS